MAVMNTNFAKKSTQSQSLAERMLKQELEITGSIVSVVVSSYCLGFPFAQKCLFISHERGREVFAKGLDDLYFIAFWVVLFTFLRGITMKYVFGPFAQMVCAKNKRKQMAEQAFSFTHYIIFWSLGMSVMYRGPHWRNTAHYWIGYPHELIPQRMKYFYLLQMAFWFQQLYIVHIETKRKDHVAMMVHHIVTITLLVSSYYTNFTRIGNAVLCCMDLVDVLLPFAKILNYLTLRKLSDAAFGMFVITWIFTRHIFFGIIVWATYVEPQKYLDMKWDPEHGKYMTPVTQRLYVGLFLSLSIIMVYWSLMIVKVIFKVIQGGSAEDTRSEDELETEEDALKQD